MSTTMTDLASGKTFVFDTALPGRDAYEEALAQGFEGTRADWLASLKGFDFDPDAPDWESDRVYGPRAAVLNDHRLWVARTASQGVAPGSDPAVWKLVLDGADAADLVQAVADANQHRADADTARAQTEAALAQTQTVLGQTQAAAAALAPIEALHPTDQPRPKGWWDTGDRLELAAPMIARAVISNWHPGLVHLGVIGFQVENHAFTDLDATQLAQPGQPVAAVTNWADQIVAAQPENARRPTFGRHPASGLRNRLPNNRMDGAALGVLGAGGALPTGWSLVNIATGEVEIVSLAPKSGRPNIRIRLNGTPTGNVQLTFNPLGSAPSATGQTWTGSAWVQRVGGSTANITNVSLINTHFSGSGFAGATNGGSFLSTIESDLRRVASGGIAPESVTNTRGVLQLVHASGPIDITLDISAPQLEQASEPSAVQITGANGFDVTDAGQPNVHSLGFDGVDDRLTLATSFSGHTSYTLAAAHDVAFLPAAPNEGIIFGGTGRFTKTVSSGLRWRNQGTDNQVDFSTQSVSGRQVDMVRVAGAAAPEAWRNGQAATISTAAGSLSPLVGLTHFFNAGSSFSKGRLYAAALIPQPVSEADRIRLQRYLSSLSGVIL
ncbi:hypothetical protein [Roseinatronobacter sp. NSM]|uniref:hypothetical protein n=1 Tax=Roseinatronobacter sp. NSM TaxID=3457785 RepID=UPI004035587B